MKTARLIFEDGKVFFGKVFANGKDCNGELVFNTAMSGYQEVLTDPSYCGQIVMMTYPLIGNYGINEEDIESDKLHLKAFVVREYLDFPSNWRSTKSLKEYLEEHNILGIEGLDTRAITRYVREKGSQKVMVTASSKPLDELLSELATFPGMLGQNLAKEVTCSKPYKWNSDNKEKKYKVAVIDCGVKYNILRQLNDNGCECHVFPITITAKEILEQKYDGVFVSNGPGDPEPVVSAIKAVKELLGKIPIFGICLGNQILGLALGGKSYKLKFGHHGANHPVKNLKTGKVEITSQNHGFNLDMKSLNKEEIEITHINLNDNTVEGFKHKTLPAFSVQYHPEAAPGPHDSQYLFKEFIKLMKGWER
jgi:carbamoyl-phosphate synthase small subunit